MIHNRQLEIPLLAFPVHELENEWPILVFTKKTSTEVIF
jgi:hypothetical protein